MGSLAIIGYIAGAFGLVATLAAAFIVFRSTISKTTISTLQDSNKALMERVEILEKSDKQKTKVISELQKEVDTFKNIPLKNLAITQAAIMDIQKEILEIIKGETHRITKVTVE